ncbi:MAG: YdcH family protein [Sphingorhabdus sp.]
MSDRDFRLLEYHQKLDAELRGELRRVMPSFSRIQRLKRLKLAVKDKLQRLSLKPLKRSKRPELA